MEKYPNLFILSDEIYSRILFDDHKHISLKSFPSIVDRVIVLDGWSKTYAMTGWRLGYGIFPNRIFKYAKKLAINCHSCVNVASQYVRIEALNGSQKDVDDMIKEFDKRRKFIVNELNLIDEIDCVMPGGAFYVFPRINKNGLSSKRISNYLLENKYVATVPGSSFGDNGEGFLRISYASNLQNLKKNQLSASKNLLMSRN